MKKQQFISTETLTAFFALVLIGCNIALVFVLLQSYFSPGLVNAGTSPIEPEAHMV